MSATDPLGISRASQKVWEAMLANPEQLLRAQTTLAQSWLDLLSQSGARAAGSPAEPVAVPEKSDKRFLHPAWSENPLLDATKQAYLIATNAILSAIETTPGVDRKTVRRAKFFAKQFCDAVSPSNVAFLNPMVVEETMRTGGENLRKGMANLLADLHENGGRVALVDKTAFELGKNVATTPGKVVHRNELAELIQYAPTTKTAFTRPLLIVPPWINKYYVLDLQPANSMIKYLADQGFTVFVISWRNPKENLAAMGMDDYLRLGPLECAQVATRIGGTSDVNVVAYCIGGTLVAMLLAYLKAKGQNLVASATFLASLVDFEDAGEIDAFLGEDALAHIEKKMNARGYLEGSEMADTFTMLRSNDLIWSVAVNRYLLGKDAPAFDLLYWNSDSTRMPRVMHSYYLRNMYLENNLVKPGALKICDLPIDVRTIDNDAYVVATLEDHIAPWRSVYKITQLFSGTNEFRLAHSGHIAGIVNPPAKRKGYWLRAAANPPDPEQWLGAADKHEGSWWPDWIAWLAARSKSQAPARHLASENALADAPGTYVFEK